MTSNSTATWEPVENERVAKVVIRDPYIHGFSGTRVCYMYVCVKKQKKKHITVD